MRLKFEILNPKIETNPNFKMFKIQNEILHFVQNDKNVDSCFHRNDPALNYPR